MFSRFQLISILAAAAPAALPAIALAQAPAAAPPTVQQGAAAAPNTTTICRFQTGPLSGQTRDFAGASGFKPFAVGAPCTDGKASIGVAQADRAGPSPSADRSGVDAAATPYQCRYRVGPRAGQTGDFQAPPQGVPRPGATCTDGKGSRGLIVR